jgi:hypothetical protein
MIRTVAGLLDSLKQREVELIVQSGIRHAPTIGQKLITEQFAPLRIVFGYEGYASEHSLRKGFLDFLERNPRTAGFGTTSLPSLIVCGGHSLVKLMDIRMVSECVVRHGRLGIHQGLACACADE